MLAPLGGTIPTSVRPTLAFRYGLLGALNATLGMGAACLVIGYDLVLVVALALVVGVVAAVVCGLVGLQQDLERVSPTSR